MGLINWYKLRGIKSLTTSLENFLETVFGEELRKKIEKQRLLKGGPETFEYLRPPTHRAAKWYEIIEKLKKRGYSFDLRFSSEIEELQNLILFAYSLDVLVQHQVISLNNKQVKGNLLDPKRFESMIYEVLIAANHVSNNFDVELPDLLKTGNMDIHAKKNNLEIYAECKRLRRSEKYVNIAIESMRKLHKHRFSGIIDVLPSKPPTTGKNVNKIVNLIEKAITSNINSISNEHVTIKVQKLPKLIENIHEISLMQPENIEYMASSYYSGIFDGVFKVKEPKLLILRNPTKPERLKRHLLDSLSKAYDQLRNAETKLGARRVIYIDISEVAGKPIIQLPELIRVTPGPEILSSYLEQICREWLLKHLSIDAIILTQIKLYSNEYGAPYALIIENKPVLAYTAPGWSIETAIIPMPRNASPEALVNLGIEMVKRGNYWLARTYYGMALSMKPDIKEAWNNLGRLYTEFLGRPDIGLKHLEKALKLDPTYVPALVNKGIALAKLGRYDDALRELVKAVELDPNDYKAWYNKALIHYMLGQYERACKDCSKALKLKPDYDPANKLMNELQKGSYCSIHKEP